jgi:hypothetical protein
MGVSPGGWGGSDHLEQHQQAEVEDEEDQHGDEDGGVLALLEGFLEVHGRGSFDCRVDEEKIGMNAAPVEIPT